MISLFWCGNARYYIDRIRCIKGHKCDERTEDSSIHGYRLKRGDPLEFACCQNCADIDRMDDIDGMGRKVNFDKANRGWRTRK